VKERNGVYTLTVNVKNTGAVAGKEVVQLYVSAPKGSLPKPSKELKAFAKTKELLPGETQSVELTFTAPDLASFSEAKAARVTDAGIYRLLTGASAPDIRNGVEIIVAGK
jgi:beta-glucosidase